MLEKLATFSEKLEKNGLFNISDKIEKSIKIAAAPVNYPGFTFMGYDTKTGGPWYQGQGKYWYQPPGGNQWIPYTKLPGQTGGGQKSLSEDPYTKLYKDPKTGYLTSAKFQADQAKANQEAAQIAVGTAGIAGTGLATGTHLGSQVAKNYEVFNKAYLEMRRLQNLLSKTSNARDIANYERQIQQLGNQAMKAYNNFQRLSKFDPRYLSNTQGKVMIQRANNLAKILKIDLRSVFKNLERLNFPKLGLLEGNVGNIDLVGNNIIKDLPQSIKQIKLRGLLKSSKALRFLDPMAQHVALSRVPEVIKLAKYGVPAAKIASKLLIPIGVVLDLITVGSAIYGGIQANKAVQEANKNTGLARMQGQGQYTSGKQIRNILKMNKEKPQRFTTFVNSSRGALQNYARFIDQTDLTPQEKQQFIAILNQYGIQVPTGQDPGSLGGGFWSTVRKSL